MSTLWIFRFSIILASLLYLVGSRIFLQNRDKYHRILESGPLNVLFVIVYNVLCYLLALIPSDPKVFSKPALLKDPLVNTWYLILGQIICISSVGVLIYAISKRKVIGAQDTRGKLLTTGIYFFSRHPIYLGIVLISLSFVIMRMNFDGMLVFPIIFLVNFIQAKLEEKYDVGVRFKEVYDAYKKQTRMFAPFWFWVILIILIILPLIISRYFSSNY
jgi:protein-S-isoprenylcysteine O-methyltransferase Ste14